MSDELKNLTQKDASQIVANHEKFLAREKTGRRANFSACDLSSLDFSGRNLAEANFTGAKLQFATLKKTRLVNANFLPPTYAWPTLRAPT